MVRKVKIIATIGPSCQDETTLRKIIESGMDVARLNFSHGTHEEHRSRIEKIREISKLVNKPISILQDLQGPKLRVGILPKSGIELTPGHEVVLRHVNKNDTTLTLNQKTEIPFEVPSLVGNLNQGDRILLDDGNLEMEVSLAEMDFIRAKVVTGGILYSHKGVNFPGVKLDISCLTEKDKEDLAFGLRYGVDAIALSFVRVAKDISILSDEINRISPDQAGIPIIAKLERPEAIDNLSDILRVADGVMVARGDLAVETSPSLVPIFQKRVIRAAFETGKLVITATQMLDSMINNPRPTRAEASDVANAVFDGTDAVMLSGETANGQYPIESVLMMDSIVVEAERHTCEWGHCEGFANNPTQDDAVSITRAARELAHDRNVAGIAVFTQSGHTALLMSKTRPQVPILAFTPNLKTYQKLGFYWGVTPFLVPYANSTENLMEILESTILSSAILTPGQQIVIISGFPVGAWRPPNLALLHTIGDKNS
jgi:pyruvate kinase